MKHILTSASICCSGLYVLLCIIIFNYINNLFYIIVNFSFVVKYDPETSLWDFSKGAQIMFKEKEERERDRAALNVN